MMRYEIDCRWVWAVIFLLCLIAGLLAR
jgi:hypothetical protein